MRLKKTVALALVTAMAATMTAGCGGSSDKGSAAPETTAAYPAPRSQSTRASEGSMAPRRCSWWRRSRVASMSTACRSAPPLACA